MKSATSSSGVNHGVIVLQIAAISSFLAKFSTKKLTLVQCVKEVSFFRVLGVYTLSSFFQHHLLLASGENQEENLKSRKKGGCRSYQASVAPEIMVDFKRVAAAFNEAVQIRPYDGRESENCSTDIDLLDLVNSFFGYGSVENERENVEQETDGDSPRRRESYCSDSETKKALGSLFDCEVSDDAVKKIRAETALLCRLIGTGSPLKELKRQLMNRLRERGYDAGLCKTKWGKTDKRPIPWDYEYVDVNLAGSRYVVEVFLAENFEIARPTKDYIPLLELFPPIFVGKLEELKQIVRIMCRAMKESLKSVEMHVPPWRTKEYMLGKWLGSYKRTTSTAAPPWKELNGPKASPERGCRICFFL